MKNNNFMDYAELGEYLYNLASKNKIVSTVLFRKDIIGLLRWFMEYEEIDLGYIDIENEFVDSYSKEYYLTIDGDFRVTVEPIFDKILVKVIPCYSDIILLDRNVNSKIEPKNENCVQIEISIANDDEENFCGDCCYDCNSCPKAATSQVISSSLSFTEYILNHYDN